MLIATWNVNSIRSRLDQVKKWLKEVNPDLLCLQETKVDDPLFPFKEFNEIGYSVVFYGQKSYNGVAILSKDPLTDVRYGFNGELPNDSGNDNFEAQKRIISGLANRIRVINLYVPNGSSLKSDKYNYKINWLNHLVKYLDEQKKRDEYLCILGDFNIAMDSRDIHDPNRLTGGIMASKEERNALKEVLGENLHDVFRAFESDTNFWSWWDYRSGAWDKDRGWRIDHIYLCDELLKNAKSCIIDKQVRGNVRPSDHAPVLVEINWPLEIEAENDFEDDFFR